MHWSIVSLPVVLALTTACSIPAPARNDITPEYSSDGRLTRLSYDRNGDGKVETLGYMDGARVVRVEVDEDGDGKVDKWEYHAATASTPDMTVERIERATRHDGKITRREFFALGAITRVEEDTDADGLFDKWETYEHGSLRAISLDTRHLGTPDRRMLYGADGTFLRLETDESGSGHFPPLPPVMPPVMPPIPTAARTP